MQETNTIFFDTYQDAIDYGYRPVSLYPEPEGQRAITIYGMNRTYTEFEMVSPQGDVVDRTVMVSYRKENGTGSFGRKYVNTFGPMWPPRVYTAQEFIDAFTIAVQPVDRRPDGLLEWAKEGDLLKHYEVTLYFNGEQARFCYSVSNLSEDHDRDMHPAFILLSFLDQVRLGRMDYSMFAAKHVLDESDAKMQRNHQVCQHIAQRAKPLLSGVNLDQVRSVIYNYALKLQETNNNG